MRISIIFFYLLLITINPIFSTTYKLTHPGQVPWPGFFSIFNTVLGALDFYENTSDAKGLIVDFEELGLFYDSKLGENWWEYYFEPIRLGTIDDQEITFKAYKKITFSFFAQLKMSREKGHDLISKYIKLKPHIQNKVDAFVKENFENNTIIGIHYRGTDKNIEAPIIKFETIEMLLSKEIENNKNIKIFVATDEENFLNYMYKSFPGKIIALDAIRSTDGKAVHTNSDIDPYQKGEDALLDCLLLSRCSKLYKTASNLSDTSIKFNPTIPVINISHQYVESKQFGKYNFFKVFNTILSLLDNFETNKKNEGFTAYLPTRDANWWEYHFEPLVVGEPHPKLELNDADLSILGFTGIYEIDPNRAFELLSKYIEIKPHVLKKVDEIYDVRLQNSFVVGVFYMKEKENDYQHYNEIILKTHKLLQTAPEQSKILLISNDQTFISLMHKEFSTIVNPTKPQWNFLDGEMDLYFCLLMARTNGIIGSRSIHLKTFSKFNPHIPVIEIGEFWLEK